ncbi:MAG: class I SAM-dependent methyltransferase [Acidobacteria bacterium]|nr:MAG: class I SAM-dependent methyltransferase [Acidobacteriota bacterium]REJ98132.1 MAG: class I SAM-dependent methyltransferase [Acidobacteriota bacterium]REK16875.1 MAG: class I SAM-dependent methyltransferase [Acidobacteriota bacterium]REK42786.1 MAG: class I SAM-dependent methyltransferase [Acidobacteriota bacterium]
MKTKERIERHYGTGRILEAIKQGLQATGKDLGNLRVDDVSDVDEFHLGGRVASEHFFPKLSLQPGQRILDVGAGIGGGARFAADTYGVSVTGIDLTSEYVQAGREISDWTGMSEKVELNVGDATHLEFDDASFDGAFTMHVLMNIENKATAFAEVYRVLKPGSVFGIYDIVQRDPGDIAFPVPWADEASSSFLSTSEEYVSELESAGFNVEKVEDRYEFALGYFKMVREKMANAGGPPPLGIHLLMGESAKTKLGNVAGNLEAGLISSCEFIARKS